MDTFYSTILPTSRTYFCTEYPINKQFDFIRIVVLIRACDELVRKFSDKGGRDTAFFCCN